jgi:RHS repeat-associated protein
LIVKIGASSRKLGLLASVSCVGLTFSAASRAQTAELPPPPVNSTIDARGVDLASGQLMVEFTPLSIGDATNGLKETFYYPGLYGFRHDQMITATADDYDLYGNAYGYHVTIATGKVSNGFTWNGSAYVSDKGDGATLSATTTQWTYTDRDGVIIILDRTQGSAYTSYYNTTNYYGGVDGLATTITRPDGFKTRLTYKRSSYTQSGYGTVYVTRLQSTTTSTGYQLKFTYRTNSLSQSTANDWVGLAQTQAINNAVDYCDPAADACTGFTQSWPTLSVASTASGSNGILSFTDPSSRTSSFTFDSSGRIIGYRRPSASSDTTTYGYYTNSTAISSVTLANVGTWNYTFSLSGSTLTGSVTTPTVSTPYNFTANYNIRQPLTLTDENGHTTTFTYDSKGRVATQTLHGSGSNFLTYNYDTRGNLLSVITTPKTGSGLGTLTTSATYPSSCAVAATCNKPTTSTDSAGKVTNYYYNSNGTLDYVQAPAPTSGAARPEMHYSYTTAQARVKNASGSTVDQGDVVTLATGTTACITGAWSCAAANQLVTQLSYYGGPSATNLLLQSSTVKSGSGSPTSTTTYAYDSIGNVTSVTDPVNNVTQLFYAADRQSLGVRSPSVDGSPTSRRRAVIHHYNSDGLRDSTTYGSVNPDGTGLTTRRVNYVGYDSQGRKTLDRLSDGTTDFAITQYSYTSANRLDCVAVRMKPESWGSLPSSACTAVTPVGSYGPDRITKYLWENAGALDRTQSAYGTGLQRDDVRYTRTTHDLVETMTDAKGNVTSFVYDGHDRLLRTCYNTALASCTDSASDIVKLTYNSAGRLTNRSLRGTSLATTIGYNYDDLGRVVSIDYPGSGTFDKDVTFTYDNLGRQLSATDASGHSATFAYDALGNVTSQGDAISARTMLYDAAGRRTRLTWSDGNYVTYEYNGASDLTAIKESGTTSLASFGYDDIGRRSTLTRGNGVVTSYAYNPLGLTSLANDLAGTASDQTLSITARNPAGQIVTRTGSNDIYAWTLHYNFNRNYTANGLNQYTASGAVTPTYDVKGNLASAGASTYSYSTKNELVQTSAGGVQFYPDPLGRIDTILNAPSGTTKFQYDGANISTELDGGNALLRRYVWGPGDDEPLVWYEGSGLSSKRWLVADERGSVIAVTDASGNATAINSYDDYGIPGLNNQGRFQYTGQAWIPELGLYSYKARIYSPTLGRFLQTDPIRLFWSERDVAMLS